MSGEPIPPGETGTELTSGAAMDALGAALKVVMTRGQQEERQEEEVLTPRRRLVLRDLDVRREGRYIVLTAKFRGCPSVTVKLNRGWARVLRGRLTRVLNA